MKRVSLVLGSGGARGMAHIGVIRSLEEHGFQIDYISGSSIGALVGGIYAAGKLETYTQWVCELQRRDIVRLLDWSFRRGAVLSGDRIVSVLEKLIGEHRIENLETGFTAVATELNEQREVWLNRGSLFEAIRASIAMPLVFQPVKRGDDLLVDGGLVNPVPIAPVLNAEASTIIAVDLGGRTERLAASRETKTAEPDVPSGLRAKLSEFLEKLGGSADPRNEYPGPFELGLNALDTMEATIARMKLAAYQPELLIRMPRNLATLFEFHRARELIDFGYERANEALRGLGE